MSKSSLDSAEIYKGPDGAFFSIPYKAATARMRNEASDPDSVALLAFKIHGSNSGRFVALAEAARVHFKCDAIVAVPGAGVALNSVQLSVAGVAPVVLRPRFARPNRHNAKEPITAESETQRIAVDWQTEAKRLPRVLLLDDVARTGTTLTAYSEILISQGVAKTVVRFSLGRSECRFAREATLTFPRREDIPSVAGSGAKTPGGDASRSPGLERLRELQGDKAEIELARTRGELVDRDSVHAAFAQVVEIVKADLMALPGWAASELTSLGPEEIEKRLERKTRAIALGFERKCGDVRLIAAVPKQEPEGKPKRVRKRK